MPSSTSTYTLTPAFTASPTLTVTPSPTLTPTSTNTPTLTPTLAPLAIFTTRLLRQGVLPQPYLDDTCESLSMRWDPDRSQPGTVVLPIMFHSIAQDDRQLADPARDITISEFTSFVEYAHLLGFETITTQELYDFLTSNAPIPTRSMMIIIDDRRPGTIQEQILPALEEYDWTVTAAYIADPNDLQWAWDMMDQLFATGRLDVQSHGYSGKVYIQPETPIDQIQSEIWDSTAVLEQHFSSRPIAFIWPGGNFTSLSVQVARQGGYELGFTAYSRGPVMFNWVPLGEEEQAVDDPLMVLPRAWSSAANVNMDEAVKIGEQAQAFAEQNFTLEADWYHTYCGGELNRP
jgi:peptidoglycan/xylan/chitin deacetylase (PgdA/CDA1 family)